MTGVFHHRHHIHHTVRPAKYRCKARVSDSDPKTAILGIWAQPLANPTIPL